jgi:hypothetical protein
MAATLETLTAAMLAADAAWNESIATFKALPPMAQREERSRLFAEKESRRALYVAARDAFEAAGGDLNAVP